jgi:DNA-binding response OmpR family regulator
MFAQCRVLVVENFCGVDEILSIIDDQAGYEVTLAGDRDAAFTELDRGGELKARFTIAVIGCTEPMPDLKLAEYAALRGCVVIGVAEEAEQREPLLARGYDLVDLPCRPEELIVRLAAARLRAGLAERRPSLRAAELRRRRRVPAFERGAEFARLAV